MDGTITDIYISRKQRIRSNKPFAFLRFKAYEGAVKAVERWNGADWEEPIDFRRVMNWLMDNWTGEGEIESRDVGPYRCLITFDSTEIRVEAMNNSLLLSVFDEVRPHWDIFWNRSRRVWMEIEDLPVYAWSEENLNRVASLWGKLVMLDDRIEEKKSFSTVRMLVDCYEWERINEWVSVKIGDRKIEIYVKEFGGEIYSVQSHPNRSEVEQSETISISNSSSEVKETGSEVEDDILMHRCFNDSLAETIINCGWGTENVIKSIHDDDGARLILENWVNIPNYGYDLSVLEPMFLEAQIEAVGLRANVDYKE
ncbi:hypothetical protein PIB30_008059 [Stylosanthes scabra]|uniref:RRM domain-containing protein n=1 Tax=Stylosanthes scabra TaxID=79078 RepID=A0ABU6W458_9FABA|nr:hypothetical protein [Stylosanthes scabra]